MTKIHEIVPIYTYRIILYINRIITQTPVTIVRNILILLEPTEVTHNNKPRDNWPLTCGQRFTITPSEKTTPVLTKQHAYVGKPFVVMQWVCENTQDQHGLLRLVFYATHPSVI